MEILNIHVLHLRYNDLQIYRQYFTGTVLFLKIIPCCRVQKRCFARLQINTIMLLCYDEFLNNILQIEQN